jgi:hypothetical protein
MFLTTGAPTLTLVSLGLVMVPQMVVQAKSQGAFDYMWSLPVPRPRLVERLNAITNFIIFFPHSLLSPFVVLRG